MIFVYAVLLGLIPAGIAKNKGHSFLKWWLFGALVFIVALPCSLFLKPLIVPNGAKAPDGAMARCPSCAELVQPAALVCKHCGNAIGPRHTAQQLGTVA